MSENDVTPAFPDVDPQRWWERQRETLVAWAGRAAHANGVQWLDDDGEPMRERGVQTWLTARATHVGALAWRHGTVGARAIAELGVRALLGPLRDETHGGWFTGVDEAGVEREPTKSAYTHAFVLLAGATAASAGVSGGRELLDRAAAVVLERFWDDEAGLAHEDWDRAWEVPEPYRGANSNMHMVEAFLATAAATSDPTWARRAARIADFLIVRQASAFGDRLPEHFSPEWEPLPEYNSDRKADPFRPYGWTPGHSLEWARLLLHIEAALPEGSATFVEHARRLADTAVRHAWAKDGSDGFCYTLDWSDRPVVGLRMHWVAAEAIAAAEALHRRTGEDRYRALADDVWGHVRRHFVDSGNWHHELDAQLRPSTTIWQGRPDIYHAYTAIAVSADLPVPGFAVRTPAHDAAPNH
ncbi:AGE family epimerase/isomerase [Spiractinospora alimapuensis]|uniref:AGE family epimerase/isomerase n=1 Tax=Spiractinospora alimapuensis TaxID=2820884 RepID=UPI001F194140|nr:AGE family epimerase/isomerase [Spiractinospora alimapuensis]QVQ50736.1 AGE family epimerase/isomerase [Spiractinospora alimapuensis]